MTEHVIHDYIAGAIGGMYKYCRKVPWPLFAHRIKIQNYMAFNDDITIFLRFISLYRSYCP